MIRHARTAALLTSTMLSVMVCAGIGLTATANAQTAEAKTPAVTVADAATQLAIADIVVTAERRRQPQQAVPVAITGLTDDQMWMRGITTVLQLSQYVPNMIGLAVPGTGGATAYYLRGLGTAEAVPTTESPVGTFVDDVRVTRQTADDVALFDLDRIEVLRGPQATLHGANTIAGVVGIVLAKPAEKFGGYAELGYGSRNQWLGRASLDLPLGDHVAVKLSGYYRNEEGYVANSLTGEVLNDSDASGGRAALRIDLGDHLRWDAAIAYMYNSGENLASFGCDPANPASCDGRFSTTGLLGTWPNGGTYNPYAPAAITGPKANTPLGNIIKTTLVTSNLQWVGGAATLSLITGVVDTNQSFAIDFADGRGLPSALLPYPTIHGYPSGGYSVVNQGQTNRFSQEVKLDGALFAGRVDYVVGGYFSNENDNSDVADAFNLGPVLDVAGAVGAPVVLADRRLVTGTDTSALYGQVDFHATARLTLTGGLRWTDETRTFAVYDNRAGCTGTANPANTCLGNANLAANGVAVPTAQTSQHWTPKFVATWRQDANLMFYASATNGTNSGGWNTRGITNDTLLSFAPESAWSYELGMKSQWLDNRLRANLTAFYLDVSALQVSSTAVSSGGAFEFTTQNVADFRNQGIELEVTAVPIDHLVLFTTIGYQNARYVVDSGAPDVNGYGVKSVAFQQQECRAQLAQGKIPLGAGVSNAPSCAAGIVDANGNIAAPVRTPAWSVAIGGTYNYPIPSAGIVLSPTVNLTYRSSLETGNANGTIYTGSITSGFDGQVYPANPFGGDFIAGSSTGSRLQVNAQLALTTDDENWQVALACENCFDKSTSQASIANYNYYNVPMIWTVRAKRTF